MKQNRNKRGTDVTEVIRGLRRLLRRGAVTPAAVLASPELIAAATELGHPESGPDTAVLVAEALTRAVEGSSERDIALVLFGLQPTAEEPTLGARRAAAAGIARNTADSFRVRREPRLLEDIARALLVELAMTARPAEGQRDAHLEFESGTSRSSIRLTAARSPVVLGRSPDCDIQLRDDPRVSRHHASLSLERGRWVLRDLGSRNGTECSRGAVDAPVPLEDEEVITVGATRLTFRSDDVDMAATVGPSEDRRL